MRLAAALIAVGAGVGCVDETSKEGCGHLRALSSEVCTAKVDCGDTASAFSAVEALFAACQAGEVVPLDTVNKAIGRFEDELHYRCCAGNALHTRFAH